MKFAGKFFSLGQAAERLRGLYSVSFEPRPKPILLRPYGVERPQGWGRLKNVASLVVLTAFCVAYGFAYALFSPFLILQFAIPIVVLGALVVWALPNTDRAPTGLLEGLFFAYVIALVCWPSYLALSLPGLPWITMIRLIGMPMVVTFMICLSLSQKVRSQISDVLNVAPTMWKMMIGLIIIQLISIGFADEVQGSIQKFIVAQLNWTAIFFISCYVFLQRRRAERWAMLMWGMTVFICLIGLYEWKLSAVPWAGHIPSFLKIEDESVQRILSGAIRSSTGAYRLQATFTTPLGLGEFIALSLPFILHFLGSAYRLPVRLAAGATVPLVIFVVLATDSRLGLIGTIMSFLGAVFLWATLWWRRRKSSIFGPAIVLAYPAFFCAAVASTFIVGRIREKVWGSGQYSASNGARLAQVESGLPMIATHPLGHGIGMGGSALGYTNPAGIPTIDSYYLLVGLDYGPIGFVLYYGLFIVAIVLALRCIFRTTTRDHDLGILSPVALALFNFLVIKSIFSNDENHPLAFMMLGMVMALAWRTRQLEQEAPLSAQQMAAARVVSAKRREFPAGRPA